MGEQKVDFPSFLASFHTPKYNKKIKSRHFASPPAARAPPGKQKARLRYSAALRRQAARPPAACTPPAPERPPLDARTAKQARSQADSRKQSGRASVAKTAAEYRRRPLLRIAANRSTARLRPLLCLLALLHNASAGRQISESLFAARFACQCSEAQRQRRQQSCTPADGRKRGGAPAVHGAQEPAAQYASACLPLFACAPAHQRFLQYSASLRTPFDSDIPALSRCLQEMQASSAPEHTKILGLHRACRAHGAACLLARLAFAPCPHCSGDGDKPPGSTGIFAARFACCSRSFFACFAAASLALPLSNAPLKRRPLTAQLCPLCCFLLHCWLAGGGQSSPVSADGDKQPGGVPPGSMKSGKAARREYAPSSLQGKQQAGVPACCKSITQQAVFLSSSRINLSFYRHAAKASRSRLSGEQLNQQSQNAQDHQKYCL